MFTVNGVIPKIIDVEAQTSKGPISLQAANDYVYLHRGLRSYLENELLENPNSRDLTQKYFQSVLGKIAKDVDELRKFTFDDDLRVAELMVLLALFSTRKMLGTKTDGYVFLPGWQSPGQQKTMKQFYGKESWDGFLVGVPTKKGLDGISIPVEIKSLMSDPAQPTAGGPNEQLCAQIKRHSKHFQHSGTLYCILAMPYTDGRPLSIDLANAADVIRDSISRESIGSICLFNFPYDDEGRLCISVLCAIISQDPKFMTPNNTGKWMREINFGRSKPRSE